MADQTRVWVADAHQGWALGTVTAKNGNKFSIKLDSGEELTAEENQTLPVRTKTPIQDIDDLIKIDDLNEASVLHNLKKRYSQDKIYTNIGELIVSVNPFKAVDIYGDATMKRHNEADLNNNSLPPHIFTTATNAYRSMMSENTPQSIVISGESGSGKTEATKYILKFLAYASSHSNLDNIAKRVLAANPVLEAFGNAKTVKNNNSSRFGKFIRVFFNPSGQITGAQIEHYLLEKTRIVFQASDERNYHVFYYLLHGASEDERRRLGLTATGTYNYLCNGRVDPQVYTDQYDRQQWQQLQQTMNEIGITREEQQQIMALIAVILHLGNIEFKAVATLNGSQSGSAGSTVVNGNVLSLCAKLLGVEEVQLQATLTGRSFQTGNRQTQYHIPLTPVQAKETCAALARAIYHLLFDWLIARINISLKPKQAVQSSACVGVLDIYGFEVFHENSLEQLLINYANERLQQLMSEHWFKFEQLEYEREGIAWSHIDTHERSCIDLLEHKTNGLLSLLDEEGRVPKGSDEGFMQKLKKAQVGNPSIIFDVKQQGRFTLRHFIEDVTYNVNNFLEKNKDTMSQDVEQLLSNSSVSLVKLLFTGTADEAPVDRRSPSISPNRIPAARKASVCIAFKNQLAALATVLTTSKCHFVRCIKPNETAQSGQFDGGKVMNQLRSTSIVQVVKLRRAGYGARYSIDHFWERYQYLIGSGMGDKASRIKAYLKAVDGTNQEWQVGSSKVFLKDHLARILDQQRGQILNRFVVAIQKYMRRARAQRQLIQLRQAREQQEAKLRQEQMRREQEERARREQEERMRRETEERSRREQDERLRREQEERKRREEEAERLRREQEEKSKPVVERKFTLIPGGGPKKHPMGYQSPFGSPHSPFASPRSLDNTMSSAATFASPRSLESTQNYLTDTAQSAPDLRYGSPQPSPRKLPVVKPSASPSVLQVRSDSPQLSPQSSPRSGVVPVRPNRRAGFWQRPDLSTKRPSSENIAIGRQDSPNTSPLPSPSSPNLMSLMQRAENNTNVNTNTNTNSLLNPTARSGPTAIGGRRVSAVNSEAVPLRIHYGDAKMPKIIPLMVDREIPLKTHIGCILEKFNIPAQPALFALYHPGSNSFIQQADLKDKRKFDALRGEEVHLKLNPAVQSNKTIVDIEQTIRDLFSYSKKAIFDLIKKLQNKTYAVEFGKQGGMKFLITKIPEFAGNTLAYALNAVLSYLSTAADYEFVSASFVQGLFDIVSTHDQNLNAWRNCLAIIVLLLSFVEMNDVRILGPIEQRRGDEELFRQILKYFETNEVALLADCLRFFSLFSTTLSKLNVQYEKKFIKLLRTLGLNRLVQQRVLAGVTADWKDDLWLYQMSLITAIGRAKNTTDTEKLKFKLTAIYHNAFPEAPSIDFNAPEWRFIGFQNNMPFTELEAGDLGVKVLFNLATTKTAKFKKIIEMQQHRSDGHRYPVARVTFKLVNAFLALFRLDEFEQHLALKRGERRQTESVSAERMVTQPQTRVVFPVMFLPDAFTEICVIAIESFDQIWLKRNLQQADIDAIVAEVSKMLRDVLYVTKPTSFERFRKAILISDNDYNALSDQSSHEHGERREDKSLLDKLADYKDPNLTPLQRVIKEIISTEYDYVNDLNIIDSVFLTPLRIKGVLTEDEIKAIFGNIEILLQINTEVIKTWEEKKKQMTDETKAVAELFLSLSDYFKMYTQYCTIHTNALILLEQLSKTRQELVRTIQICESDPKCRGLFLISFLIKPVQRICKYPLFFKELLKYIPTENTEAYESIIKAQKKIEGVVDFVNDRKRKAEILQRMSEIEHNIEGLKISLLNESREYLKEGELVVNGQPSWVFLFNDLVIIAKPKAQKDKFENKAVIELSEARVVDRADGVDLVNCVELDVKGKLYQLQAKNTAEKKQWFDILKAYKRELQLKQIKANKTGK